MALVAYGASDDSDLSEEEEEEAKPEKVTKNVLENGHISDEEDEFFGGGGDDFIPEKEEQDVFSLIAKKLPNVARMRKTKVAEVEEVGPIPEKKDYGVEIEQPPAKKSKFIGKEAKKTGPAKIVLPSLTDFKEEEEEALPSVRVEPSRSGSGLFALLPRPKNKNYKMPARAPSLPSSSTSSSSRVTSTFLLRRPGWTSSSSAVCRERVSKWILCPWAGQYCTHFTLPCSCVLVSMMMCLARCSTTILQKSTTVFCLGPCVTMTLPSPSRSST